MLFGILMAICLAIFVVGFFVQTDKDENWPGYATSAGAAFAAIMIVIGMSCYQVPFGHVGIVYRWGDIVGQRDPGLRIVPPWESMDYASTQLRTLHPKKMGAFTKTNSQEIFVDALLNFRVSKENVQHLYRTVGPRYESILMVDRLEQVFKEEIAKYETLDVAPKRERIRHDVSERMKAELAAYSIVAEDLFLKNIEYDEKYQKAIEATQIAEQEAKKAKWEADKAIKIAEGEGQAILIKAQKQAEANKTLSSSITNILVQYETVQKLSPNVQVIFLQPGQQVILPPEYLTGKGDSKK